MLIVATMAPRPSIIAVMVAPLRPGLRCRLLRATLPSRGNAALSGRAAQAAMGLITAGMTNATPIRNTTAPRPTRLDEAENSPARETTINPTPIQARMPT